MAWLPDGEKNLMICLFVLTLSTNVTDRRTDGHTGGQTPHDDIGRAWTTTLSNLSSRELWSRAGKPRFFGIFLGY